MEGVRYLHLQDFETPRIVRLDHNLHAAAFFLMKLLPARFILERAFERGELSASTHICETSSGTFGLALAMLAARMDNRLTIVSDWAIDAKLKSRLIDLGAEVEIVTLPGAKGGLQQARLDRLQAILSRSTSAYWPRQYENPDNPRSYSEVAARLAERIGQIDCLVGTVGSGGSLCGTARYLRLIFPELKVIAVDTMNSVLFGQPDATRLILGLGGSVIPNNIDHTQIDEVHWLSAAEIFHATRQLHGRTGLFMGPTSGAAFKVATWWACHNRTASVAVLMPDEGHRYIETAYDEGWLDTNLPHWRDPPRLQPSGANDPWEEFDHWTRFAWARRSRADVLGRNDPFEKVTSNLSSGERSE